MSILSVLPHETLLRVLELLPPTGLLVSERVCHSWREAVGSLGLWPEWRTRCAVLAEAGLSLPGVPTYPFGAPPTDVPAEARDAMTKASEQAGSLPSARLELARQVGPERVVLLHLGEIEIDKYMNSRSHETF